MGPREGSRHPLFPGQGHKEFVRIANPSEGQETLKENQGTLAEEFRTKSKQRKRRTIFKI